MLTSNTSHIKAFTQWQP